MFTPPGQHQVSIFQFQTNSNNNAHFLQFIWICVYNCLNKQTNKILIILKLHPQRNIWIFFAMIFSCCFMTFSYCFLKMENLEILVAKISLQCEQISAHIALLKMHHCALLMRGKICLSSLKIAQPCTNVKCFFQKCKTIRSFQSSRALLSWRLLFVERINVM